MFVPESDNFTSAREEAFLIASGVPFKGVAKVDPVSKSPQEHNPEFRWVPSHVLRELTR
jgi:hypothetical protein